MALELGKRCQEKGLYIADQSEALKKAEVLHVERLHGQTVVALQSGKHYQVMVNPKGFERTYEVKNKELEQGWSRVKAHDYQKGERVEFSKDGIVVNAQKSQAQKQVCQRELRELSRQQSIGRGGPDFDR